MFASSRIDKGGGHFRPLVKPRNSNPAVRSSATPVPTPGTESSSETPQPSSSAPGPTQVARIDEDIDGEKEDEFLTFREPLPVRPTPIIPSRATSIVPTRGTAIAPNRGASIVPTQPVGIIASRNPSAAPGAVSIAPTRGLSIAPTRPGPPTVRSVPAAQYAEAGPSRPPAVVAGSGLPAQPEEGHQADKGRTEPKRNESAPKGTVRKKLQPKGKGKGKEKAVSETPAEDGDTPVVGGEGSGATSKRRSKRVHLAQDEASVLPGEEVTGDESNDDYQQPEAEQQKKRPQKPRKRKQAAKSQSESAQPTEEGEDGAVEEQTTDRRKRRKRTALDLVPEHEIPLDEDGEPMQLDPEVVTMAELCMDMGVGRPSSRTEEALTKASEWKAKQRILRAQIRQRQKDKFKPPQVKGVENDEAGPSEQTEMQDGGDADGETGEDAEISAATRRLRAAESSNEIAQQAQEEQRSANDEEAIQGMRSNKFAAQVRIDENGEIIIDDLSLTVDRYEAARAEVAVEDYELVEEAERDRFVNSLTWTKKIAGSRWTKPETDLFYYYTGMWGTDFEMIAHLMAGRTRREIRNKYNAEMKKDPMRMESAFTHKIPMDLDDFSKATGIDLSGPPPELPSATTKRAGSALPQAGDETEFIDISVVPDRESASPPAFDELERELGRTTSGDESGRASPTSATSSISRKGKLHKPKSKSKKSKRKGTMLAEDEEVIGSVPIG